jgi:pantothenate kinase-related protein Tda10
MAIQELSTLREECRVCLAKWRKQAEGLETLVKDASKYSADAFSEFVNHRMPELLRATKAFLARLSIFIQVKQEIESEERTNTAE